MSTSRPSPAREPRSAEPEPRLAVLVAACDLAVLRALELIGRRCAKSNRARFGVVAKSGLDWFEVHTVWAPEPRAVDAALSGAWAVLPRLVSQHGCCALVEPDVQVLLDAYVRELVASQRPHDFAELERRLTDASRAEVGGRG